MVAFGDKLSEHSLDSKWLVKVGKAAVRHSCMRTSGLPLSGKQAGVKGMAPEVGTRLCLQCCWMPVSACSMCML